MSSSKISQGRQIEQKILEKACGLVLSEAQILDATSSSPKVGTPGYQSAPNTLSTTQFEASPMVPSSLAYTHGPSKRSDTIKNSSPTLSPKKQRSTPQKKSPSFKQVFGLRMETLIAETLRAQRSTHRKLIEGHLQTIKVLKAEIASLETNINTKTTEIKHLRAQFIKSLVAIPIPGTNIS